MELDNSRKLSEEEEEEARRMAAIAERAEQRAAERAAQKLKMEQDNKISKDSAPPPSSNVPVPTTFLTKQQREQLALEKLDARRKEAEDRANEAAIAHQRFVTGQALEERKRAARLQEEKILRDEERRRIEGKKDKVEEENELKAIREHYLGGDPSKEKKKMPAKASEKLKKLFKADWDNTDDTARFDMNPLYKHRLQINPLYGKGHVIDVDHAHQRKNSNIVDTSNARRSQAMTSGSEGRGNDDRVHSNNTSIRIRRIQEQDELEAASARKLGMHWSEKALASMQERDWRIFREDFDIRIQHGRAVNPLRFWSEANFPDAIMRAIQSVGYKDPSPIQRQAIPIGLARRDVIGIAETGSGKTAAFVIPLLCNLLHLPPHYRTRCAEEGPLAVVMAPTRELAQQIEEECIKLAAYTGFVTACIVGGQSIEEQSIKLRQGVQIIIGTPGRMVDCIESNFLVLNQCNYVVLDEADRMVDMGFEVQVIKVLDVMGGLLKSEDVEQAEMQLAQVSSVLNGNSATHGIDPSTALFRVTAMFSATMPVEVERIAKTYLRHPAIIKIGDHDSGKNKRIEQRVVYITEGQKKGKIVDELRRLQRGDKSIVFVNAKKQGDVVGRFLEQANLEVGILHGGKSQDQREATLESFRKSEIRVLVATDVAGRGLDIQGVSHVFNFDCPAKIENYCHRIGRTGRAGKSGIATTFLTDGDSDVMYDLKAYLESTDAQIPSQLKNHPAAQHPAGTRGDSGNLVGQKRGRDM